MLSYIKQILLIFLLLFSVSFSYLIDFSIALKPQNIDLLENILLDVSNPLSKNYGNYWEIEDINKLIEPDVNNKLEVVNWLKNNNITNEEMNIYSDGIVCHTNKIKNVEEIFNIKMIPILVSNRTYLVSNKNYEIPNKLNDMIDFVEGISNKLIPKQKIKHHYNNYKVDPGYVGREVVRRLYSIPFDIIKDKQSAGSIEYQGDSGFSQQNLLESQKYNSESPNPINNSHIIGTDTDYPDTESELDVQMISQTAENIDLWFWGSKNWLYTFCLEFVNKKEIPNVISMSWGWSEDQQCTIANCTNTTSQQFINRVNVEYMKMGLRGVTILVSSGDAGAPGRTSEGCDVSRPVNPVFPGSSPWVTTIGATFVIETSTKTDWNYSSPLCLNYGCANGSQELGTSINYTGWTAGGGFSHEKRPSWQDKVVTQYLESGVPLPSKFSRNGRSYPDISVVGHNCPVYTEGSIMGVDGTSCSAPIFAGIVSILNQFQQNRNKSNLGFINPMLYQMMESDPTIFNDIVDGNNWCTEDSSCPERKDGGSDFGYKAAKGYDPVTGLGTPNVSKIMNWMKRNI